MKLLITGGAGFMGSNFIRFILSQYPDYSVVNLDKLTYAGNLENLKDVAEQFKGRYTFIKGDIANPVDVKTASQEIDVIINFAAESHVDRSIMHPEDFLKTDVMGTYYLLEQVRHGRIARYIQISTDEVYGSITEGEFFEDSPFMPNSPYSASKAGGDLLCRAYFETYKLPVIVTHSCNFYGSYQYPEKIIPLFITNLLEGKKVPVYGDGLQAREWIFTADFCQALDLILHKGVKGEVYNIGTGARISNIELTKKIISLVGADEGMIEFVKDRPGHDVRYAVNAEKLTGLGFSPTVSFDEGLKKTVDWYRQNREWWKTLKSGEYLEYYKRQYETR